MSANRIFKSVLALVVALSTECSCTSDCEVPFSAKASVLVQRARTAAQAPILPEVHRTDARRRRGFGAENRSGDLVSHDQLEDVGIKIAKEQMESVQDGIVAMQTVDRDMVDRTMKEMSDMQRFFMRLVASLLFGNVLVILAICLCQASSNKKAAAVDGTLQEPLPPALAVAAQLLAGSSTLRSPAASLCEDATSSDDRRSLSSISESPPSGPLARAPERRSSGPRLGSSSPQAARAASIVQQKAEMSKVQKAEKETDDRFTVSALERRSSLRTVDAFCTPGSTPRLSGQSPSL